MRRRTLCRELPKRAKAKGHLKAKAKDNKEKEEESWNKRWLLQLWRGALREQLPQRPGQRQKGRSDICDVLVGQRVGLFRRIHP